MLKILSSLKKDKQMKDRQIMDFVTEHGWTVRYLQTTYLMIQCSGTPGCLGQTELLYIVIRSWELQYPCVR